MTVFILISALWIALIVTGIFLHITKPEKKKAVKGEKVFRVRCKSGTVEGFLN